MEKLNVSWHGYSDHLREMMHGMMKNSDLTDVTLVCDDQKVLMAHKVVLSASSPVFQNIINNFSQNHSMIYLRGIQYEEMESILEFMYLGEATFHQERMEEFLKVAQNLKIKELTEMNTAIDKEEDANIQKYIKLNYKWPEELKENKSVKQNAEASQVNPVTKIDQTDDGSLKDENTGADEANREIDVIKSEPIFYSNKTCQECGKAFPTASKMMRHFTSVHQGLKQFKCSVCDKRYAQKGHMNLHIKNAHEPTKIELE